MTKFYFLVDPLLNIHGSSTPAVLLGKKLMENNLVYIVTPTIRKDIEEYLNSEGFEVININKKYRFDGSLLTLEGWFKNIKFVNNKTESVVINFSQCFIGYAHIYYAPGPMMFALDDIYLEMNNRYKLLYKFAKPFIDFRDKRFNNKLRRNTKLFLAVSKYCASLYNNLGINVEYVIYPPLDIDKLKPSTVSPKANYVLTYIGKETKFSVLNKIANNGVKIKGFGAKTPFIPSYILNNPNIELVGKVSTEELVDLYSNALYTLFPFTHEPFGYIPIESMACSTPVLTYNKQGPAESVIHNKTGWLVNNDEQMIRLALKIWKDGYSNSMRIECRKRALEFDIDKIIEEWLEVLDKLYINNSQQWLMDR
ncbi:MAG: group 1 glycosyl transferase [Candidatus Nitrosocaldaceae archaeon]|nr:MAG: group 1 glycosyl transferase [Candidatus Nitrosocaldaceae archaeon]